MTPSDIRKLTSAHGQELWHTTARNADGTPLRCRVTGKLRTWKRDPERFQLPVKYGLKTSFYITPDNCDEWEFPHE